MYQADTQHKRRVEVLPHQKKDVSLRLLRQADSAKLQRPLISVLSAGPMADDR